MRIGIVIGTAELGGVNSVTRHLARGLAEAGHDVIVHVIKPLKALPAEPNSPYVVEHWGYRNVRWSVPRLRRLVKSGRHDVVISAVSYVNVAAALARPRRRSTALVLAEHGLVSSLRRARTRRDRALPWMMRKLYGRADLVVAVSRGVARELEQKLGWSEGKVKVLPNPALPDDMGTNSHSEPAHPWYEQHDAPIVLAASRLVPEKRLSDLISAFEILRSAVDAKLIILGEGPERERLERQVATSPFRRDIQLAGYAASPASFMAACDVVALSSEHEALPTVLLEALALGRRVVSTDCPYGPREILQDGQLGRLVPVGDPEALAQAIVESLAEPPPDPQQVAEALRPYRVGDSVGRYLDVIDALVLGREERLQ